MSTVQGTASPRAPRGKHAQNAPAQSQSNNARQGQRRPRGNRANNTNNPHIAAGTSPHRNSPVPDPTLADSAVFSSEEAQLPTGPRNPKKHTQSQPSIDRIHPPSGTHASLTDNEGAHNNPAATPAKIQGAYAGPTFHASPAPSTLPKPKFLSKSVPAKTRVGPPTPPPEDSSDSANSPSPSLASPSRAPIPVPQRKEDSPLDLLFKADRAERAQKVSGSPASNGFFSPPNPARPNHYKHDSYNSLNAPFPIELDGQSRTTQISSPPATAAASTASRSVTDPNKIPQLKDTSQSPNSNDVMQDLLNRLSMSQKKPNAGTPPGHNAHAPSDPQSRHETPSPPFESRSTVRSASGPSTPATAVQEPPDFFYGNRNLSPLFKAAKNDTSKRNSGLRTEITADSPLVAQGMFQDFSSVSSRPIDPNTFSRQTPGHAGQVPSGPRRGSVPYVQTYQGSPNNRRKTPGKQPHQTRPDSYPGKPHVNGPNARPGRAGSGGAPASIKKPATSMMSFVPASVAAKQHSTSTPPSAPTPPPMRTSTPPDTLALEQDLKRLLNLKMTGDVTGVR